MTSWLVWGIRLVWVVLNGTRRTSHKKSRRSNHSSIFRNETFRGGAKMEALSNFTLLAVEYEVGLEIFSYQMHPHRFW